MMKRLILLLPGCIAFSVTLMAQVPDNDNFMVTHGPWIQNLTPTGVTLMWTTNKPAVPGVTISKPDGTSSLVRNSTDGLVNGGGTLHKVRIDGLNPGSEYSYSLHSVQVLKYQAYKVYYGDTLAGRKVMFRTPLSNGESIKFTVYNDVHDLSGKMASYYRNRKQQSPDLWFFNGDMIDFIQEPRRLFTGFLDTAATLFASQKPFVYVRGNHETRGYAAREVKNFFDYPDEKFYYSFDAGPVHFIILDCGEDKPDNNRYYYGLADYDAYRREQAEWLKAEVRSDAFRKAKYKIVIIHMPVLKQEKQGWGMSNLASTIGPVLAGAPIDLMISAHTHRNAFYERDKTGFGYSLLVNSNNTFVEAEAGPSGIKLVVRDVGGNETASYIVSK